MKRLALVVTVIAALLPAMATRAVAADPLEGVPRYDHVFTIVLENENYASTWSTPNPDGSPTYLQQLAAQGAFASQYFGVGHVSADNYIAMTSGQLPTPLFDTDCLLSWGLCELFEKLVPDGGRNIADEVEGSGQTWRAYMDQMAVPCQHPALTDIPDPMQTGYADRHNPFVYYPDIVENTSRCAQDVVPCSGVGHRPDERGDDTQLRLHHPRHMPRRSRRPVRGAGPRPGGLASANEWLQTEVPAILGSPAFTTQHSLLLITFDENGISDLRLLRPPGRRRAVQHLVGARGADRVGRPRRRRHPRQGRVHAL